MNDHFPDATPEELSSSDATCIICQEEMTTGKKLVCGHLFHVHCLRSWLERQHTCPTCRAHLIITEGGTTAASSRADAHQQVSFVAALAVIYHAFSSGEQFNPKMVYLSTSKVSMVLLLNLRLVIMCIMLQLTKRIFLGSLREAEVERLNEQSWREVMEILFAISIFRQNSQSQILPWLLLSC